MDSAAISFARERERAVARLDHSAAVSRLQRALLIGLPIWLVTAWLDLFITQVAEEGSLQLFAWSRAIGALVVMIALWRLRRPPEPTVAVLWFCDIFVFTTISACVAVHSLGYRGIGSRCSRRT
jgi:hypothetical protein